MSTSLFDRVIFGPVRSRRLGLSLGVNLLLPTAKLCNFDCIYCECGWNGDNPGGRFNSRVEVLETLGLKLDEMSKQGELPNYITFAGNGEPTMHPEFLDIISEVVSLRDRVAPDSKIAVLSNATMIDRDDVRRALRMVDKVILKLDSAFDSTVMVLNQPASRAFTVEQLVENMKKFGGDFVLQTMFVRGEGVDNTTQREIEAWLKIVKELSPSEVMLYSIDRDTPQSGLVRIDKQELEGIASRVRELGVAVQVS